MLNKRHAPSVSNWETFQNHKILQRTRQKYLLGNECIAQSILYSASAIMPAVQHGRKYMAHEYMVRKTKKAALNKAALRSSHGIRNASGSEYVSTRHPARRPCAQPYRLAGLHPQPDPMPGLRIRPEASSSVHWRAVSRLSSHPPSIAQQNCYQQW